MSDSRPIVIGVVRITEAATMATDFAIAAICVAFTLKTMHIAPGVASVRGLWALTFAFAAVAAIVGGVVHGFALHLDARAKQHLWKATQYTMGLTGLAILAAAGGAFVDEPARRWVLGVAIAKFAAYAAVVQRRDDYTIVVADYGASMIALATLAIVGWARRSAAAAPWLVAGVLVSAVAAAVQLRKVAPHPRFNHNDLYHLVQIGALYLFYRGGLLLGDG
jgi:hypothetical protein